MTALRGVFFLLFTVLWTAICGTLATLSGLAGSPYSTRTTRVFRLWARGLLKAAGVRVEVRGTAHGVEDSGYVIVSNHASLMDIPILVAHLPFPHRIIAKKELFWIPGFGLAMKGVGIFKIDRSNRTRALDTLKRARNTIHREKISILVFPEGTRSADGVVLPFKKGPFVMALEGRLDLLPVSVSGTSQILPKKKLLVRPGTAVLTIHPPVPVEGQAMESRNELIARTRDAVISALPDGKAHLGRERRLPRKRLQTETETEAEAETGLKV